MLKIFYLSGALILGSYAIAGNYVANAQSNKIISNDLSKCSSGSGPAVLVTIRGLRGNKGDRLDGKVRVQTYNGTKQDWLETGRWLARIESLPKGNNMKFCLPVPKAGEYGVAVRHDVNGNGKTDISGDGGGFSNNPKLSTFRVITGRAAVSYKSSKFSVGNGVKQIVIDMNYR